MKGGGALAQAAIAERSTIQLLVMIVQGCSCEKAMAGNTRLCNSCSCRRLVHTLKWPLLVQVGLV
jgi:hypothetical protein